MISSKNNIQGSFQICGGADDWPITKTPDTEPPVFKDRPVRKQTKRREGRFEVLSPKDSSRMANITCGNCKQVVEAR